MKILVIHQYYLVAGQPGGSRFNEFARLWSEAGHDVTVIAGTVNYASGETPEQYRGRWITVENDERVTVIRCHVPSTYGKGYLGRMWAFFGFTLSSVTGLIRAGRPDVIIATSPPLITAIPGWIGSRFRRRRIPWIFEMRDLWPESAITTGVLRKGSLLTKVLYALERAASRRADLVNVLTPAFREDLVRRRLAGSDKIVFVPNGADVSFFFPAPPSNSVRERLGWGQKFVVMYAGAHGRANALTQLLDAAQHLSDRSDIVIASVGDGPERKELESAAQRRGLANIMFHGSVPKVEMPEITNAADVGAAVLQNNPTFATVYPNKVFDYMACEKPTLLAIDGVARKLVCDDAKAGVFARPEDGADIAEKIRWLADNREERLGMGRRGRQWVVENATREALAARYLEIMSELVKKSGNEGERT